MRMRGLLIAILLALVSAACSRPPAVRKYTLQGEIMALNPQDHIATIKHGKIGDWMEAMSMEYRIKDPADWQKLTVGERITATVFVSADGYYVGAVQVRK